MRDTATGDEKGRIPLPVEKRPGPQPYIEAVAFAPDGKKLVVGLQTFDRRPGVPANLYLCDVREQRVDRKLPGGHRGGVRALAFSPSGDLLLTAGADGIVRLWDTQTHRERGSVGHGSRPITALTFSPDGRWLAFGNEEGKVHLYGVQNRSLVAKGTLSLIGTVNDVRFSSDGRLLATASAGVARLWDPECLQERLVLRPDGNNLMQALAFSKDDAVLFTASGKTIQRWDVAKVLAAR